MTARRNNRHFSFDLNIERHLICKKPQCEDTYYPCLCSDAFIAHLETCPCLRYINNPRVVKLWPNASQLHDNLISCFQSLKTDDHDDLYNHNNFLEMKKYEIQHKNFLSYLKRKFP